MNDTGKTPDEALPMELESVAAPVVSTDTEKLLHQIRALRDADVRLTKRLEDLLSLIPNDLAALQHVAGQADAGLLVRASDLGVLLHITSPSTTLLVSRLLKAGHLVREPDPRDKRAHTLHVTRGTRAILDAATAPTRDELGTILGAMTRSETKRATGILTGVTSALDHGAIEN